MGSLEGVQQLTHRDERVVMATSRAQMGRISGVRMGRNSDNAAPSLLVRNTSQEGDSVSNERESCRTHHHGNTRRALPILVALGPRSAIS